MHGSQVSPALNLYQDRQLVAAGGTGKSVLMRDPMLCEVTQGVGSFAAANANASVSTRSLFRQSFHQVFFPSSNIYSGRQDWQGKAMFSGIGALKTGRRRPEGDKCVNHKMVQFSFNQLLRRD